MKFKLIEKFDETRSMVQEYMYDAIDELNNASLEEYIQWFKDNLTAYPEDIEQAVTDAYIEACDYGIIKGVEKTRLTSQLKEYIESHTNIIDDTDELMRQCPDHLQHELNIVLSKLEESLNEELLTEEQVIYSVEHPKLKSPVFFNVTRTSDKETEEDITDSIANKKLQHIFNSLENHEKVNGETPNYNLVSKLIQTCGDNLANYVIKPSSQIKLNDLTLDNMLMLTLSTWRNQAHKNVTVKQIADKLNIGNDYLVHHKDGKEWNNDDVKNFLIVPKGNATDNEKDFRNFIHTSLHMIMTSGKNNDAQKSKSFPLYYVNDNNEVCRTYLTLQLHTNKKLFNLS